MFLRPLCPALVQPANLSVKGGDGGHLVAHPGRLVADLLRLKAKVGGQLVLVPHLVAGQDGASLHQGEHLLQHSGGLGVQEPHLAGGIVEQYAVGPRPADLSGPTAEHLQHVDVQKPVTRQPGKGSLFQCHAFPPRYSGREMMKLVSLPLFSQRMVPPWSSTISLAMARPSPAPPVRVERAASSR